MNNLILLEWLPNSEAIGWTLLHSIWQIGLIAIVLRLTLSAIPRKYSNTRYLLMLTSLAASVIWVGLTFGQERARQPLSMNDSVAAHDQQTLTSPSIGINPERETYELAKNRQYETAESAGFIPRVETRLNQLRPYFPMLTLLYLGGMGVLMMLMLIGFVQVHRLGTTQVVEVEETWKSLFRRLKHEMGIFRNVRFLMSEKISEPVTFHFLKPVVLVPVSFFSGLDPQQVELVLLHELAHIRRHDYLINTFQSLIEILFFYHPAIWWISGSIREEREHCCDDLVLKVHNNPMLYAEALTSLQVSHRQQKFRFAMSLNGKTGTFKKRIFRLFGQYERPNSFLKSGLLGTVLTLSLLTQTVVQTNVPLQVEESIADFFETSSEVELSSEIEISDVEEGFSESDFDTELADFEALAIEDDFERLMQAIRRSDYELVKELLKKGVDFRKPDNEGVTPLLLATQIQSEAIINLILDYTLKDAGFDFDFSGESANCHELTEAVRKNDLNKVRKLLELFDPNCIDTEPGYRTFSMDGHTWQATNARTPLMAAARGGKVELARMLVAAGADVNFHTPDDEPPLLAGIESGSLATVKFLYAQGARGNARRGEAMPIAIAAREGHVDIINFFLEKGADLHANSRGEGTPLSLAARSGHLDAVQHLLSLGADIQSKVNGEGTPLSLAARSGHAEVVEYLLTAGADLNAQTDGEGTPLSLAARSGNLKEVRYLLSAGADIYSYTRGEGTPLSLAARSGELEVVKYLVGAGADIHSKVKGEGTPLSLASRSGHLNVVEYLLSTGADINALTKGEGTPIGLAARSGHDQVAAYLLSMGADINARSFGEGTPLSLAARSGHLKVLKSLFISGADLHARTKGEGTPLSLAARSGKLDVVKYLVAAGADIHSKTRGEGTPLSLAARSGNLEVVKYLIYSGADIHSKTQGEGTPLNLAKRNNHKEIIQFLRSQGASEAMKENQTSDEAIAQREFLSNNGKLEVSSRKGGRIEVSIKSEQRTHAVVEVRTLRGKLVSELFEGHITGKFNTHWKPREASGTFLLKIQIDGRDLSREIGDGTAYPWW